MIKIKFIKNCTDYYNDRQVKAGDVSEVNEFEASRQFAAKNAVPYIEHNIETKTIKPVETRDKIKPNKGRKRRIK